MLEKLSEIEKTHDEITDRLTRQAVLTDPKAYREASKTLAELAPVVQMYREYRQAERQRSEADELLATTDKADEMHSMARDERERWVRLAELEADLRRALTPRSERERNVVLEIRAGTGGDEATLFASELFRCTPLCRDQGMAGRDHRTSESEAGGSKEVSAIIEGRGPSAA